MLPNNTVKAGSYSLGVDIGGSHITAALVDHANRCVVEETLVRTIVDAHGTPDAILNCWARTIDQVKRSSAVPIRHLGIAMPGPFDYDYGVALIRDMHKYDSIFGVDVKAFLARELFLETDNIQFKNDTVAFLEGEVLAGVAQDCACAVAITLGTGLGAARCLNGHTEDRNLGSGTFQNGIVENYLSTRWFVRRYRELTGITVNGVKELLDREGDNACVQQLFHEFSQNLALFLSRFILFEKPDVVVIGGNIARAYDLFFPETSRLLEKCLDATRICKTELGEKAALIGAVSCWIPSPAVA